MPKRRLPLVDATPRKPASRGSRWLAWLQQQVGRSTLAAELAPLVARVARWRLTRSRSAGVVDPDQAFCSRPFEHLELKKNGRAFLCCPGLMPLPVGNLDRGSPEEVWNSPAAQRVRESILDGSFVHCLEKRCPHLWKGKLPKVRDVTDPRMLSVIRERTVKLPFGPRVFNTGYDHTCNLSCPSCRTKVISATDRQRTRAEELHDTILDWAPDLETLFVTGTGDPFASSVYRRLLARLEPAKHPKLQLRLQTNALLLTPKVWESMHKMHDRVASLDISIDAATPDTYRVLRRGGDFETLRERLAFVREIRRSGAIRSLSIRMVVQQRNYREMPLFVELGREFEVDLVRFSTIWNWGTFGPREFAQHAVHRPTHPEHSGLLEVLADPRLADPRVQFDSFDGKLLASVRGLRAAASSSEDP